MTLTRCRTLKHRQCLILLVLVFQGVFVSHRAASGDESVPTDPPLRWWKGNIHTHSFWSDGNDFPEMIAEWYRTRDYNFLAISDHNVLSEGERWMKLEEILRRGDQDTLRKYRNRFGGGWVETRGVSESPEVEVRLKPLNEFRALIEERGKFILIQGEEITDRILGKPVHLNATNIKEVIQPLGGNNIREGVNNNLRAVEDQARRTGREILLHLNHPSYNYTFTAEDLAAVLAERFFEVFNGHPSVNNQGDEDHPSVDRLWDIANTIRLDVLRAPPLYGLATDDSHRYHGRSGSRPGRGWIMVQSRYLTPEHLIRAVKAGNFYASSGVTLSEIDFDAQQNTFHVRVLPVQDSTYTIQFVGTLNDYDRTSSPRLDREGKEIATTRVYSEDVGRILQTTRGTQASYKLTGKEFYVRAVVTSNRPPVDPIFEGQLEQAWTQPVGWKRVLAPPPAD
jgi:hypothetical protein